MKFLDTIKGASTKVVKGMVAIFAIKILLLGGLFIFQSCQTGSEEVYENLELDLASSKFENLVKNQTLEIQGLMIKHQQLATTKTANFNKMNAHLEKEAKEVMLPIVDGTKELLQLYGIDESDFTEEFEDINDPRIAFIGLAILAAKDEASNQIVINFTCFFSQSVYAQGWYDCALRSVGIDAIIEVVNNKALGSKAAKKLIKKAIRKVAMRAVGWIGAAIAVYEFGDCMKWY